MGCWAVDSFGNDDAADWLIDLEASDDLMLAAAALRAVVVAEEDYLDASDAADALAAAEVVAAACGRPSAAALARPSLNDWLARVQPQVDESLLTLAQQAVQRVLGDDSELAELWQDSDDHDEWLADVQGLLARLVP